MRTAKLGPDHPDTLSSMQNLACAYDDLGRYGDALALFEETLALRKAKLGPDHPDTLRTMNDLARVYGLLGRYADALALGEETLALLKAKLGPDHPDTLITMWCVAASLVQLDRSAEAAPIIEDCLKRSKGKSVHPELIRGLYMLRIRNFQETNDAAGCRATANMYEQLPLTKPSEFYDAACLRAIVAAVVERDQKTPRAEVSRLATEEADRAMALLQKAIAVGYSDVQHMQEDADFVALRSREDFNSLVVELQSKTTEIQPATADGKQKSLELPMVPD